ncbi:MAG: restriction endonuclease subunit S [Pseudomonadota bacterium]
MSKRAIESIIKQDVKTKLKPKLRFPEFREAEGWKAIPLNHLAVRGKQKNRDEKIVRVLTNSAEFGVLDQRDYFDKDIATQGKLDGYSVIELGDYVYNPRISTTAPVGPISRNNVATGVMSPLYTIFKFKDRNNDFYAHYFKTTGWHAYMRQASSTGARHDRMVISSDDFIAMPVPVASPEEQQKIADCLSAVDELIAAETRKLDTLKTHKKALMQQLFPCEGGSLPSLRFPKFQSIEAWKEEKLGAVCSMQAGKFVPASEIRMHNAEGLFPCYGGNGLRGYTTTFTHSGKYPLIGRQGALCGNVRLGLGKFHATEHAVVVTPENGIAVDWVVYLLDFLNLNQYATGQAQPGLSVDVLDKLPIVIPNQEAEQLRIAECLTSLDNLIAARTQKLAVLSTHKKGLMQQLFPSFTKAKHE